MIDGPAPEPVKHPIDHVGVQKIKNGLNAVGVAPITGRVTGTILSGVADLMEKVGSNRARFTPFQKLVVLDVPDDKVDELVAGLDALGLPSRPSSWRKNTDGLHRNRVLQAVLRRNPGAGTDSGARTRTNAWRTSTPTSTCQSPSTSTDARTRAPEFRSPTSGSRASGSTMATAIRSRASRSTSAAAWARKAVSAENCASTRSPATNSATTSTG